MSYFFHPAAEAEHLESVGYFESRGIRGQFTQSDFGDSLLNRWGIRLRVVRLPDFGKRGTIHGVLRSDGLGKLSPISNPPDGRCADKPSSRA